MTKIFENFAEAYHSEVRAVMRNGDLCDPVEDRTSVGSQFGKKLRSTREIIAHKFIVTNPRNRTFISKVRPLNIAFCHANFIWTLTGGGNVEGIGFYNARGRVFAKNAAFYEAAFGARLFYPFQQFRLVESRLVKDPSSRRGLAMIYIPEDTQVDKLDTPCATYLHFMIRQNQLVCICNMRSQSALMVLPYDFFLFSMIHECLAVRLDLEMGSLVYTSNSFHIYDDEFEFAEDFLANSCVSAGSSPPMQIADDKTLGILIEEEQKIRMLGNSDPNRVFRIDEFWGEYLQPLRDFASSP